MNWTVTFLDEGVQAEIAALTRDIRSKFERIVMMVQEYGLERVHEPYVKHIEGSWWFIAS